jgi:hypothetical protein
MERKDDVHVSLAFSSSSPFVSAAVPASQVALNDVYLAFAQTSATHFVEVMLHKQDLNLRRFQISGGFESRVSALSLGRNEFKHFLVAASKDKLVFWKDISKLCTKEGRNAVFVYSEKD